MEPVEINAGAWYLRGLRDDSRVTDVPALASLGRDAGAVAAATRGWDDESLLTWAVCEPTTGELRALIEVDLAAHTVRGSAIAGAEGALEDSLPAVQRCVVGIFGVELTLRNRRGGSC